MTVKELRSILDSIPYSILTYDNSDYEFYGILHGIEIRFEYDNFIKCYLIVYISGYMRDVTIPYNNEYDKCVQLAASKASCCIFPSAGNATR